MGGTYYSNCSTITTGCYIYNDIYKTSIASNGIYSDGTNCYTVSYGNGYVSSIGTCLTNVYINVCGDDPADSVGGVSVTVRSMNTNTFLGSTITVDTTLTIEVVAQGSSSGNISGTLYINNGNNCGTGTIFGFGNSETIDGYFVNSITPSSSGTQSYIAGSGFRNGCWSCP